MTEIDLGQFFMERGINTDEIVLGFLSPKMREYSDFAIA
jgi:hypothetical protein